MMILRAAVVAAALLLSGQVLANGKLVAPHGLPYCPTIEHASILINTTSIRELRWEVEQRYNHSVEVATSEATIYSTSPAFVWATEAKVSCAQAIGYLRKRWMWKRRPDYVTLQKCECFYNRMTYYLKYKYSLKY